MAFDAFLKLDDGSRVRGESADAAHTHEIELLAVEITATHPPAVGTTGGGGRVRFSGFKVRKLVDRASPQLLQACAAGERFRTAKITIRKAGSHPLDYLLYTLDDVQVETVANLGEAGGSADRLTEEVTLAFGAIHVKYVPQKKDGSADAPVEGGWNLATNMPK